MPGFRLRDKFGMIGGKDLNVYTSEDNQESYWAFLRAHIALDSENEDENIDHCIALWQGNSTKESHLRAAF